MPRAPIALAFALLVAGCLGGVEAPEAPEGGPGWALACDAATSDWPQACTVRASRTPGSKTEPWIAVNPTDPLNVVAAAKDLNPESSPGCVWNGLAVTHDGGRSWTDVTIGGKYADRAPGDPYFGWACNTDPMFAFTPDGALHYVLEVYGYGTSVRSDLSAGTQVFLVTSRDGGLTWEPPVTLFATDGIALAVDHPWTVVSPKTGSIATAFIDYMTGERCYFVASRDGGKTADAPVVLPAPGLRGCTFLAVASDGTFVAGGVTGETIAQDSAPGTVQLTRSADDGRTWSAFAPAFDFEPIAPFFEESGFPTAWFAPAFAFDASGGARDGRLYAAYADAGAGDADVVLRASDDAGATWSEPVPVAAGAGNAFMPAIAVASDGSVHVFFLDTAYDPENRLLDLGHAVSVDGGASWRTERVTSRSFDGDLGTHQNGIPFIGDYMGVAAGADAVWAAYPDSSDGVTTAIGVAKATIRR